MRCFSDPLAQAIDDSARNYVIGAAGMRLHIPLPLGTLHGPSAGPQADLKQTLADSLRTSSGPRTDLVQTLCGP